MGSLARALDMLLSHSVERQPVTEVASEEDATSNVAEPRSLSGMDLVHAMYAEEGFSLIGSAKAGFAYYDEDRDRLFVVNSDEKQFARISLEDIRNFALETAQELGASFKAEDKQVICEMNDISEVGCDQFEAAMRAILAYTRLSNSQPPR